MDVDLCPPWWPGILWWLIHHPPKGNGPVWDEEHIHIVNEVLTSLTAFALAGSLSAAAGTKVRDAAAEDLQGAVGRLVKSRQR